MNTYTIVLLSICGVLALILITLVIVKTVLQRKFNKLAEEYPEEIKEAIAEISRGAKNETVDAEIVEESEPKNKDIKNKL